MCTPHTARCYFRQRTNPCALATARDLSKSTLPVSTASAATWPHCAPSTLLADDSDSTHSMCTCHSLLVPVEITGLRFNRLARPGPQCAHRTLPAAISDSAQIHVPLPQSGTCPSRRCRLPLPSAATWPHCAPSTLLAADSDSAQLHVHLPQLATYAPSTLSAAISESTQICMQLPLADLAERPAALCTPHAAWCCFRLRTHQCATATARDVSRSK